MEFVMNMERYLTRHRRQIEEAVGYEVGILSEPMPETRSGSMPHATFLAGGFLAANRFIRYADIRGVDHGLSLQQIHGSLHTPPGARHGASELANVSIRMENADIAETIVIPLETRSAVGMVTVIDTILRLKRKTAQEPRDPTSDRQAFCPTCMTYKRMNLAAKCRLCGDELA